MSKELDDLFEFKEEDSKAEEAIKEAKSRSTTRIVAISLAVWIGGIVLLAILLMQISPLILEKHVIDSSIYHQLFGANIHMGQWREDYKLMGSTAEVNTYKIIDGEVVPIGQIQEPKKNWITPRVIKVDNGSWYTDTGVRIMQFYHPGVVYEYYLDELSKLESLENDDVIEMGLSFDKAYTPDEVENIIGSKVQLNWGWISHGEGIEGNIYSAYEVLGMHYLDDNGKPLESPEEEFIKLIDIGIYNGRESRASIQNIKGALEGEDRELTPEDLQLIGCVVVGTKEELSELKELEMIQATSIGVIR